MPDQAEHACHQRRVTAAGLIVLHREPAQRIVDLAGITDRLGSAQKQ